MSEKLSTALIRLRERLVAPGGEAMMPLSETENTVLMKVIQLVSRIDRAAHEFHIANVVSYRDGSGKLDVTWGDFVMQLEPIKAREIAWMLLEAASVAEVEAGIVRFLKDRLDFTPEQSGALLQDFRNWRDEQSSLVGQKGH